MHHLNLEGMDSAYNHLHMWTTAALTSARWRTNRFQLKAPLRIGSDEVIMRVAVTNVVGEKQPLNLFPYNLRMRWHGRNEQGKNILSLTITPVQNHMGLKDAT